MPDPLDITARYVPDPDAMESRLGDETVILHLGTGTYFGLDPVGTVVWEALQPGATPKALCANVRQRFADAPATAEADVTAFLAQLLDHALIRRA
jgi:hypothetical protein